MKTDDLTIKKMRELREQYKNISIPPGVVKTQAKADEMTKNDPVGHKWHVGDTYYTAWFDGGLKYAPAAKLKKGYGVVCL